MDQSLPLCGQLGPAISRSSSKAKSTSRRSPRGACSRANSAVFGRQARARGGMSVGVRSELVPWLLRRRRTARCRQNRCRSRWSLAGAGCWLRLAAWKPVRRGRALLAAALERLRVLLRWGRGQGAPADRLAFARPLAGRGKPAAGAGTFVDKTCPQNISTGCRSRREHPRDRVRGCCRSHRGHHPIRARFQAGG